MNNTFSGNGYAGGTYAGDVMMSGGLFGPQESTKTACRATRSRRPRTRENIEGTWGCQNSTTPNPELGFEAVVYLLELQAVSEGREEVAQPAPPAQDDDAEPVRRRAHEPAVSVSIARS